MVKHEEIIVVELRLPEEWFDAISRVTLQMGISNQEYILTAIKERLAMNMVLVKMPRKFQHRGKDKKL